MWRRPGGYRGGSIGYFISDDEEGAENNVRDSTELFVGDPGNPTRLVNEDI